MKYRVISGCSTPSPVGVLELPSSCIGPLSGFCRFGCLSSGCGAPNKGPRWLKTSVIWESAAEASTGTSKDAISHQQERKLEQNRALMLQVILNQNLSSWISSLMRRQVEDAITCIALVVSVECNACNQCNAPDGEAADVPRAHLGSSQFFRKRCKCEQAHPRW